MGVFFHLGILIVLLLYYLCYGKTFAITTCVFSSSWMGLYNNLTLKSFYFLTIMYILQVQLHVLFEHAAGYALFVVKEVEEIGMLLPMVSVAAIHAW